MSDAQIVECEPPSAAAIFGRGIDQARRYVELLAGDGTVRGLIGPREAGRLWTRHVLNSAVVSSLLAVEAAVVDIGSGAGLPGIPLAMARPDLRMVLVEPLERRSVFLCEVVQALSLSNCRVVRGRAEAVVADCGQADAVASRAVAPLGKLAAWSAPLLRTGGKMLALKGSSATDELDRDRLLVERSGVTELAVVTVGQGMVDPPTVVVTGVRSPTGRTTAPRPSDRSRRR